MNRAGILAVMLYFVRTAAITWRMAEPLFRHAAVSVARFASAWSILCEAC